MSGCTKVCIHLLHNLTGATMIHYYLLFFSLLFGNHIGAMEQNDQKQDQLFPWRTAKEAPELNSDSLLRVLPVDIIKEIVSYLYGKDLIRFTKTSKFADRLVETCPLKANDMHIYRSVGCITKKDIVQFLDTRGFTHCFVSVDPRIIIDGASRARQNDGAEQIGVYLYNLKHLAEQQRVKILTTHCRVCEPDHDDHLCQKCLASMQMMVSLFNAVENGNERALETLPPLFSKSVTLLTPDTNNPLPQFINPCFGFVLKKIIDKAVEAKIDKRDDSARDQSALIRSIAEVNSLLNGIRKANINPADLLLQLNPPLNIHDWLSNQSDDMVQLVFKNLNPDHVQEILAGGYIPENCEKLQKLIPQAMLEQVLSRRQQGRPVTYPGMAHATHHRNRDKYLRNCAGGTPLERMPTDQKHIAINFMDPKQFNALKVNQFSATKQS